MLHYALVFLVIALIAGFFGIRRSSLCLGRNSQDLLLRLSGPVRSEPHLSPVPKGGGLTLVGAVQDDLARTKAGTCRDSACNRDGRGWRQYHGGRDGLFAGAANASLTRRML